ncbi:MULTISPECIES: type II CAAX prenyl endopeptidase Rce1 family protein [unclassified Acidovorax]|uniref:CPBP family glutamic-type intramembrane protease n=1 Tax=unclassified Acidovorax TaxID=2684926 RepID=UPI0011B29C0B|nr:MULTISPECIES: CPBP family glutamic-type intramembrane protease [unclassified Acidovorax]MDH4418650.1 CPBP family glutamic-type intramembrane protease [Acidovorax sp.]
MGVSPPPSAAKRWGLGLLLACALVAPAVAWGVHRQWGWSLTAVSGAWMTWALLGAPLLEETVFRLGLQAQLERRLVVAAQPSLRRHATAWAGVAAAAAFASVHAPQHGWACVAWLVPGLALAALWTGTRRLAWCVGAHAWFNLCLWWVSR